MGIDLSSAWTSIIIIGHVSNEFIIVVAFSFFKLLNWYINIQNKPIAFRLFIVNFDFPSTSECFV